MANEAKKNINKADVVEKVAIEVKTQPSKSVEKNVEKQNKEQSVKKKDKAAVNKDLPVKERKTSKDRPIRTPNPNSLIVSIRK